jgi:membrane-bound metal-dependent hydrolase YbcI (DUF457 family)
VNGPTHRLVAGLATGAFLAHQEGKAGQATVRPILSGAVAAFFTNLPDILEPATSPNHRKFFHSLLFAGMLARALHEVRSWKPQTDTEKFWRQLILLAGSAYLIHLVLDFTTHKSLPLIGPF